MTEQNESRSAEDDPDVQIVREMERRIAKQEAAREWRPWIICVAVAIVLVGGFALGLALLPALLMRGI